MTRAKTLIDRFMPAYARRLETRHIQRRLDALAVVDPDDDTFGNYHLEMALTSLRKVYLRLAVTSDPDRRSELLDQQKVYLERAAIAERLIKLVKDAFSSPKDLAHDRAWLRVRWCQREYFRHHVYGPDGEDSTAFDEDFIASANESIEKAVQKLPEDDPMVAALRNGEPLWPPAETVPEHVAESFNRLPDFRDQSQRSA